MQNKTFIVDIDSKEAIEEAIEKMLFMYKVNKGRQDVDEGKVVPHAEVVKSLGV